MEYVYDFDIGTVLFFSLTMFFYFYQKRMRDTVDTVYSSMLICAMVSAIFDMLAVIMERSAMAFPVWSLYAVNMLFIAAMQTCLPLFLLYSIAMAGRLRRFTPAMKAISLIPYIATMLLLLASPFIDFGICKISIEHIYLHGPTHIMLYINTAMYVAAGLLVMLAYGRTIPDGRRDVILAFAGILFIATVLQVLFPKYLLTAPATALALTAVFYALQSPSDQVNPRTGAFSRTLLPSLLAENIERSREYTLLIFSIRSFDSFVRLYGDEEGDALLRAYAEELMRRFSEDIVVFMDTTEFIVVHRGLLDREEAIEVLSGAPSSVTVEGHGRVGVEVSMGAVPNDFDRTDDSLTAYASAADDLSTADYMLRDMRTVSDTSAVLYADKAYRSLGAEDLRLEATLGSILSTGAVKLELEDIDTLTGVHVAREARLSLDVNDGGATPYRRFIEAVCHGGFAWDYYGMLFSSLAKLDAPSERYVVALLPAALLNEDAAERLGKLAESFGLSAERLIFAANESEAAASKQLSAGIERLSEMGFIIMLDTLAGGYTDMSLVVSLPFSYARLSESFARDCAKGEGAKLVRSLVNVLEDIGITAVKS